MKMLYTLPFLVLVSFLAWRFSTRAEKDHEDHVHSEQEKHREAEEKPYEAREDYHEEEDDDGEEEVTGSIGPGKAVEEVHEETGLRLSDKAIKRLGIKTIPVPQSGPYPASAIVKHQEETSVYRLRQGWFKLVPSEPASFQAGDEITVSGAALLRAAELDAFGGEAGHGH